MPFSLSGPCLDVYYLNVVRAHAPKLYKHEQRHFLINWKRISVYQALFLRAGHQAMCAGKAPDGKLKIKELGPYHALVNTQITCFLHLPPPVSSLFTGNNTLSLIC